MRKRIQLRRAQISYAGPDRLDITVRSATGFARKLAPTWAMVIQHKDRELSDANYTSAYLERIEPPEKPWTFPFSDLWQFGTSHDDRITFVCFCKDGSFCHTNILIEYLCETFPNFFEDRREE